MLMSFPSRQCIRLGVQPGCTWLDDTKIAVPLAPGPPLLAKSPRPVAGWRGQTKTPKTGRSYYQLSISTPGFLGRRNRQSRKSFVARGIAFIHRQQALVAGDQGPRGVYKLLRIHLGWFHFQLRTSGRSSPFLSMYCLCSISLSLSCCFK
jgi:hypothetical protein